MERYNALRDDQWERIKDMLPGRKGAPGVTAQNTGLSINAVIYRYRVGIPWRDLPPHFGHWNTMARRHKPGVSRLRFSEHHYFQV